MHSQWVINIILHAMGSGQGATGKCSLPELVIAVLALTSKGVKNVEEERGTCWRQYSNRAAVLMLTLLVF